MPLAKASADRSCFRQRLMRLGALNHESTAFRPELKSIAAHQIDVCATGRYTTANAFGILIVSPTT